MALHHTTFRCRARHGTVADAQELRGHCVTFLFASVVLLLQAPAVSVWAAAPADLRIRTTATSFTVGSNGSYNVSVRNESNIPADDTIQIVSTLPQGLTYVSGIGAGWTCSGSSGRSVNCKAAGLASTGYEDRKHRPTTTPP